MCSYSGQEDGRVGLYIAAEPLTSAKNYFEVEIMESGIVGAIGLCPCYVYIHNSNYSHYVSSVLLTLLVGHQACKN